MKTVLALVFSLFSVLFWEGPAFADVTTVFTLGFPRVNYVPALTQDGVPTSGIWSLDYVFDCGLNTCAGGPEASISISLPNDPVNPGNRLNVSCTGTVALDTRPAGATATQQPPGVLESTETCPFSEPWFSGVWTGTLTYNYVSVKQTHCSGGRGGHCITAYWPVLVGGNGTLDTADPPPPPPPPPPPIVSILGGGAVSLVVGTVSAVSTIGQPVALLQFDLVNYLAVFINADGTTPTVSLDYWTYHALDDDGELFGYSILGTILNPDGTVWGTYDCEFTATASGTITGGTLTEYPQ